LLNRDMDRVMEKAREAERLVEETLPADETAAPQDEPSEPVIETRENGETKTDPDAPKDADRVLPNRATDCDKPGGATTKARKKARQSAPQMRHATQSPAIHGRGPNGTTRRRRNRAPALKGRALYRDRSSPEEGLAES
jgi:hypothetical protein